MESNGAMHPNMGPRMQGLEISLQHHNHHHFQNLNTTQSQMAAGGAYINREYEQHQQQYHPAGQTSQLLPTMQTGYQFVSKNPKIQTLTLSDDDEPGQTTENSAGDDGKKTTSSSSPWHRMKWTDNMVRLLIMVVYYIGDEVISCEPPNDSSSSGKKKGSSFLQKKGKWKSVSMAMMERGIYVSPQQCEDKFNDLNKRYKRVNDILGKGISCKVVENQSLLDSMDHLTPKMKEEVKKLLNSKHLFFRQMCAYHNSCGHGTVVGGTTSSQQQQQQQEVAVHDPSNQLPFQLHHDEDYDYDYDEDDDDDEDVDYDDNLFDDKSSSIKRQRKGNNNNNNNVMAALSLAVKNLGIEINNVLEDETKNVVEKRQWMKGRLMELEEQHMGYECQGFALEKKRLNWIKYRNKKEREMEREKMTNERKKLENERMALMIRQKDLQLIGIHYHHHQIQQSSSMTD